MSAIEHVHSGKEIVSELNHHKLKEAQHDLRFDYLHMSHHAFKKVVHEMQHTTHALGVERDHHGNVVALSFHRQNIFSAAPSQHEQTAHHNQSAAPESQPKHEQLPAHHRAEQTQHSGKTERSQTRRTERPQQPGTSEAQKRATLEQQQAEQQVEKSTWANHETLSMLPETGGKTEVRADGTKTTTWGTGDTQITRTLNKDGSGKIVGPKNLDVEFTSNKGEYTETYSIKNEDGTTTYTRDIAGKEVTNFESTNPAKKSETSTTIPGKDGSIRREWGPPVTESSDGSTRQNGYLEKGDNAGGCSVTYYGVGIDGKANPANYTVKPQQIENDYKISYQLNNSDGLRHIVRGGTEVGKTPDFPTAWAEVDRWFKAQAQEKKEAGN
jgi:hypothetical protein